MSRGLGQTQRMALAILAVPPSGLTLLELAGMLGVPERRTRKIVASLVDRGLVVIVLEDGCPQRVWTAENHAAHLAQLRAAAARKAELDAMLQRYREARKGKPRTTEVHCGNCGAWVQTSPRR